MHRDSPQCRGGILLLHIPCNNFASLFVVRFFLGLAEACIVPAFLLILSMFFTYDEQGMLMQVMWACGNSSPITSGLLSYGVLYVNTGSFAPWKWFMGESAVLEWHIIAARVADFTLPQSSLVVSQSSTAYSSGSTSQTTQPTPTSSQSSNAPSPSCASPRTTRASSKSASRRPSSSKH